MKKGRKAKTKKKAKREYDFQDGARGKYASRYAKGSNVVVLSPDVAKVFPDSASANRALRAIAEMMKKLPKSGTATKR